MPAAIVIILCLLILPFALFRILSRWAIIAATALELVFLILAGSKSDLGDLFAIIVSTACLLYNAIVCVALYHNNANRQNEIHPETKKEAVD